MATRCFDMAPEQVRPARTTALNPSAGESLHERLGRGRVDPAVAAAYLKQVASALDYAHGQGVEHQDLKPGNVMINGDLAKVMDFGIARRVQESLSTMSKIEIAGTPAYMSPEQEQGVVTPSADVFALCGETLP